MLRLGELIDRAVIDMDAAEKLGQIDEIVLDPDQCMVAGLVVVRGKSILGGGTYTVIPATAVNSIGTDAVTVHGADQTPSMNEMPELPRRRDVIGRRVVGQSGNLFGHIDDVLVDPADGRIIGYQLGETGGLGGLENLLGAPRDQKRRYVRAEADLRVGSDIVVVPDDAVVTDPPESVPGDPEAGNPTAAATPPTGSWGEGQGAARSKSVWRQFATGSADASGPSTDLPTLDANDGHAPTFEEPRPLPAEGGQTASTPDTEIAGGSS